jgi:two-component system, LytTR family, response regulator
VIADDEPLARERVRTLLESRADVVIAGEARDGEETLRMVEALAPDLLLLDVQMPGLDGFEVVAELGRDRMPAIVFITAYDEYAVRAFEVQALDYVVKPFPASRLHEAIDRAVARRGQVEIPRAQLSRFVVRTADAIYFVRPSEVMWLEAEGNYVRLHAANAVHTVRTPMRDLEQRLDPAVFVRVHRGAIVNLDFVQKLEPYFHGEFVITLKDGSQLTSGRTYSPRLRELLK